MKIGLLAAAIALLAIRPGLARADSYELRYTGVITSGTDYEGNLGLGADLAGAPFVLTIIETFDRSLSGATSLQNYQGADILGNIDINGRKEWAGARVGEVYADGVSDSDYGSFPFFEKNNNIYARDDSGAASIGTTYSDVTGTGSVFFDRYYYDQNYTRIYNRTHFTAQLDILDGYKVLLASGAPEPSAWALMLAGVGLAGLALRMRRRFSPTAA